MEVDELTIKVEVLTKSKTNFEKQTSGLQSSIADHTSRNEIVMLQYGEVSEECAKMMEEINDLRSQIAKKDEVNTSMIRSKSAIIEANDELKRTLDEETKGRNQMAHQLQAQKHDTDMLRQLIEEEQEAKQDLQKNLTRSNNEVGVWRNKYESDAVMRNQELEDEKKVLLGRLADSEEKVQQAVSRCESLGKAKDRLQNEVEDLTGELEKANASGSGLEKKQRNFDKQLLEAKQKQGDLQVELDTALKDARNASNELFKYRTASYEIGDNLDNVLKKNKSFQEEIVDLQALVQKGIKDGQENEKSKREIDQERGDLQHQLQEAEAAIQAQESKFLKVQIELSQMQQTSERRLNEKEEDIDNARRIATKSIEQEKSQTSDLWTVRNHNTDKRPLILS